MEALFPFGSKGTIFYIFLVRTLLFSTAILFCLFVQWIPLSRSPKVRFLPSTAAHHYQARNCISIRLSIQPTQ